MQLPYSARVAALGLFLLASGCHLHRPGEVRPEPIAACEPQRVADLERRFEQITSTERELLTYCRNAQAAAALDATRSHVDFIADVQFLSIALGLVSAAISVAVVAARR